jgi:hypothetical protein
MPPPSIYSCWWLSTNMSRSPFKHSSTQVSYHAFGPVGPWNLETVELWRGAGRCHPIRSSALLPSGDTVCPETTWTVLLSNPPQPQYAKYQALRWVILEARGRQWEDLSCLHNTDERGLIPEDWGKADYEARGERGGLLWCVWFCTQTSSRKMYKKDILKSPGIVSSENIDT